MLSFVCWFGCSCCSGLPTLSGEMLINDFWPGKMVSLEKQPVTYFACWKRFALGRASDSKIFASNLKVLISCLILLKITAGLELYVKVLLMVGWVLM